MTGRAITCGVLILSGMTLGLLVRTGVSQDPTAQGDDRRLYAEQSESQPHWWQPPGEARQMAGAGDCSLCHQRAGQATGVIPGIPGVDQASGWVLLNELLTWGKEDKHYQAYTVLLNERSERMGRLLGVVDENGESVIHRDRRCLACHSSVPLTALEVDDRGLVSEQRIDDPVVNLGVGCEGCHGPSLGTDDAEGWNEVHRFKDRWRFLTAHEKWSRYGYWDVRSRITKTQICLSCHLGNVEQGKIVTHEMYAAGHPPLPGFEVITFAEQQPRHWRQFAAKRQEVRDEFLQRMNVEFDEDALWRTQQLLVGAAVTMAESMDLTADLLDKSVQPPSCAEQDGPCLDKPQWPELANFACYACHHELRVPGWRQSRDLPVTPGRPLLQEWPHVLVRVAAETAEVDVAEYERHMAGVYAALDRQPFGAPQELQSAARSAAEWAMNLARSLDTRMLDDAAGWKILQAIVELGQSEPVDYDSARQLIWAFAVVYEELMQEQPPEQPSPYPGWYPESQQGDDPVRRVLGELGDTFAVDLRIGAATSQEIQGQDRPQVEVELERTLPLIDRFDPQQLQAAFAQLKRHIEEKATQQ